MRIPAHEIAQYLPTNLDSKILAVHADTGRDALVATAAGVRALHRHGLVVDGEINKHKYLKYVRICGSVHEAARIQAATERSRPAWRGISRNRQDPGAARWVSRPDHAKCGQMGGVRTVFLP